MADSTPRLYSNPVDPQTDYAPLSWMAASSLAFAGLFALFLVSLSFIAFSQSKPLVEFWLFGFPIAGIVLAFAARRHIQNSEGTRTGLQLATVSWWICVVGGLCYAAYLGATEYTIRSDSKKQFSTWADNLQKIQPATANDPALAAAFYQTLPPEQRGAFTPNNTTAMQDRFNFEFTTFRQNKLLMMLLRNPGQCELEPQGLKQWQQTPGKIECAMAATLKCPEGEFPMLIPMEATVKGGKREWQIKSFDGYVQDGASAKRTNYGWMVEWLDATAKGTAEQFVQSAGAPMNMEGFPRPIPEGILSQPLAYETYVAGKLPKGLGERIAMTTHERMKVTGALGFFWPTSPEYAKGLQSDFFVHTPLPDGKMAPETSREDFYFCWNNVAFEKITQAGRNLANSTDKNSLILFYDDRVEVYVAIELKVLKSVPKNSAALGRIVLTLDNKDLLAKLNGARAEGAKSGNWSATPTDLPASCPWKVTRIESNLKVIASPGGQGGGGPGGPGGM